MSRQFCDNNAEFARRGDEIYERDIRPRLGSGLDGQFVVIDIETGQYEIDPSPNAAGERLRARLPQAQFWLRRVGRSAAFHFGARPLAEGR
jgi:hypothetical protein